MKKTACQTDARICVGTRYSKNEDLYLMIYDVDSDSCTEYPESELVDKMRSGYSVLQMSVSTKGQIEIQGTSIKDMTFGGMLVGWVYGQRDDEELIGYDIVWYDGRKEMVTIWDVCKYVRANVLHNVKFMANEAEFVKSGSGILKWNALPLYTRVEVPEVDELDRLKTQLVSVLEQMEKIRPVQFHDIDCDDCVYNFSDVVTDAKDNRVYVEIAMWHDNLPSHANSPLNDGRGNPILPRK